MRTSTFTAIWLTLLSLNHAFSCLVESVALSNNINTLQYTASAALLPKYEELGVKHLCFLATFKALPKMSDEEEQSRVFVGQIASCIPFAHASSLARNTWLVKKHRFAEHTVIIDL